MGIYIMQAFSVLRIGHNWHKFNTPKTPNDLVQWLMF